MQIRDRDNHNHCDREGIIEWIYLAQFWQGLRMEDSENSNDYWSNSKDCSNRSFNYLSIGNEKRQNDIYKRESKQTIDKQVPR